MDLGNERVCNFIVKLLEYFPKAKKRKSMLQIVLLLLKLVFKSPDLFTE